ncbi:Phosphoinositide phosphatase sac1 [Dimargaris xerosporica]|nr:Phosphoinositide phosphatase sac1 [Dimargaris xerosporica]
MHSELTLRIRKDVVIVEPTVGRESAPALQFQRASGEMALGDYLAVITQRLKVGAIRGHSIYRVLETKVVPFNQTMGNLNGDQKIDEQLYLSMFQTALTSNAMFFSYSLDLTNTLQRQHGTDMALPLWKRADTRFYWNWYMQSRMAQDVSLNGIGSFLLPVLQGFVAIQECTIKSHVFTYMLISRRSRFRVGTRYFSRGADEHGNVSNFIETEQVVSFHTPTPAGTTQDDWWQLSHVQTRGSIPIFWAQIPNMRYVPELKIPTNVDTLSAFKKHFDQQIALYGDQILVNLVNKVKYEEPMGLAYSRYTQLLDDPRIQYTHFDFHRECSKMRWHRISILVDRIKDGLTRQSYFAAQYPTQSDVPSSVVHEQVSVVRTNCMDCLDRTNVVQSVISRFVLTQMFRERQVLEPHENIDDFVALESMLRNIWADNANAISTAYSGTGALKTDFTRTGQRTKMGALMDGVNSTVRYIKNTYLDGRRQDGLDLLLGNYVVQPNQISPFGETWTMEARVLFGAMVWAMVMLFIGIFVPRADGLFSLTQVYYNLTWILIFAASFYVAMKDHAYEFINWPKLVPYPYRPTVIQRWVYRPKKSVPGTEKHKRE